VTSCHAGLNERLQSLIFPIVRFRAKCWLPFLLVAVSLGCSAEAETTARTETSDGTSTGVAPVTPAALAPTTTGQEPTTSTGQGTTTFTDQPRIQGGCRLGKLKARDHVSARCVFYDVNGPTLGFVANELAFGVRDPDGGTWHAAMTSLDPSWSFPTVPTDLAVRASHAEVHAAALEAFGSCGSGRRRGMESVPRQAVGTRTGSRAQVTRRSPRRPIGAHSTSRCAGLPTPRVGGERHSPADFRSVGPQEHRLRRGDRSRSEDRRRAEPP